MTSGAKRIGTVYRVYTWQKQGPKYSTSQCDPAFDFDTGSDVGVRVR